MPDPSSLSGYPALALICFLCGVALPFPEDVPQVWAGMRIANGELSWAPAVATAMVAIFARDALFFAAGRQLGDRALAHPWAIRLLGVHRIDTARDRVRRLGPIAVLLGRFTIGFRTATFFTAGALGVRARDFALWDLLALAVSVPLLLGLGHAVGEPVVDALLWLQAHSPFAVGLAVLLGLGWFGARRYRPA